MVPYGDKPVHVTNVDRRFILNYYFSDDAFGIFEICTTTATGFGSRFLQRMRLINPDMTKTTTCDRLGHGRGKSFYSWNDCKVGSVITANAHNFEITDVDERT